MVPNVAETEVRLANPEEAARLQLGYVKALDPQVIVEELAILRRLVVVPDTEKNGTLASPATARASIVFPVPGGPTSNMPLGILAPTSVKRPGFLRNFRGETPDLATPSVPGRPNAQGCLPAPLGVTNVAPCSGRRVQRRHLLGHIGTQGIHGRHLGVQR